MWDKAIKLAEWLIDKLAPSPQTVVIILITILIVVGGSVVYVTLNDPVLLTAKPPFVSPKFPSEGLEQLIPQQREKKLVVLFHRVVWDLDHWKLGNGASGCAPPSGERTECDEVHSYGSWTVVVPTDGKVKLTGTSSTGSGELGDVIPLTPHTINKDKVVDGQQNWYIANFLSPPGAVDVIIVRRDFFGGFQPVALEHLKSWEPPIDKCQGNTVGIVVRNPTARAELILHTPPEMPIRTSDFSFWRHRTARSKLEQIFDEGIIGNAKVEEHNIHWSLSNSLLRDADNEDISYLIGFTWARPITVGPICGPKGGAR
jgi:hypothetical protein